MDAPTQSPPVPEARIPTPRPVVLAVETSCDETAVAILRGEELLASEVASQIAIHAEYGGVVPEVASRNHLRTLKPVLAAALKAAALRMDEVDAFAATSGPGLATSLMLGMSLAKGLAVAMQRPFLAINHMEGHLLSPFFSHARSIQPSLALVVSGGHTMLVEIADFGSYRLLGQTQDDAAGEAFDKVGKLLGLPYPGGPAVSRLAGGGNPERFDFPRSMAGSGDWHFSFSGLKTSVRYLLPKVFGEASGPPPLSPGLLERQAPDDLRDLCASFQEAIVDVLVKKTLAAARQTGRRLIAVSGGVSCNARLREVFAERARPEKFEVIFAEPALCTDNAAMIGYVAAQKFVRGETSLLTQDIDPNQRLVA